MIIGIDSDSACLPQGFANEKELQDLIQRRPAILDAIAQINRQGSSLMLLAREFGVQSGSVDFLACDVDANLYVIETKLAENPEIRRAVIGQVLEYGSNLRDMPFESFRTQCNEYLGQPIETAAQKCFATEVSDTGGAFDPAAYVNQLRGNLAQGRFCIAVVTNRVNFEIQRLFNFLDENTSDNLNFLVLEINRYDLGGKNYVHANVVWAAKYIRSLFSRKTITEGEYLQSKTAHVQDLIAFVDKWCIAKGLEKVQTTRGISWKSRTGGSIFVSNDWLDTNWSTLRYADSEDFRRFKAEQVTKARDAGFQLRSGKHGGFSLPLSDNLTKETVSRFVELAFAVLDRARREQQ